MKAFTNNTHGRNHYFNGPKEHKVPKSSKDRRGAKTSKRQENALLINQGLHDANVGGKY
jgi:hypothetical protein